MTTKAQDSLDAVVIGAGPAGLAVARQLDHQHGIKALVLDRAAAPAISWRTRYDAFRLNTTGFLSHLPGQRIPLNAGRWPTKEDMVRYFDHYVQRQNIALMLGCEVHRVDRAGGIWQLDTSSGEIRTPAIVLATGNYSAPTIPAWPGLSRFNGEIVHSADFANAWPYRGRDVLVVGAGNSAADIAVQLVNDGARRIWLAVRTPPHLVRRAIGPFPSDIFLELFSRVPAWMIDPLIARMNRLMWGDLSAYGFQRPPLGLKATVERTGRIPTLADELIDVVRVGRVEVVGAVKAVEPDRVILADGTFIAPQVIIAATGFGADLDGLVGHLGVLDERGNPRGGFASHVGEGMFAIGYGIPPNGPLRAIRINATRLAAEVAVYLKRIGPSAGAPLGYAPADLVAPGQRFRVFDGGLLSDADGDGAHERQRDTMILLSAEKTFLRGTNGYETARRETVWNGLLPDRFPDVIVQAHDTDDVVAAIRYARANGHHVGVCSGGRSWAASHLRDGGLLLDVSRLDHCTVEPDRMTADVGPGKAASAFATDLDAQGLFFPAGHCEGIRLGGYLLQGGYGWNSSVVGPACESVLGLDVVTADGEQIYCDPENHPDLYWAARGSGPGFFAVVTSFKLRIYPRPAVWGTCLYMYPIEVADEVFTWARSISSELDDRVELQIHTARSFPGAGLDQPGITIASPVFAGSEEEATKALAPLGTCPVIDKAIAGLPYAPTTLANWYTAVMTNYPQGHRYVADSMFTSASAEELLPGIRKIIETMPPHPSHFIFTGWKTSPERADMVYGLEDEIYIALYTIWQDRADDERYRDWAGSNMAAMSHLATGISLADENLCRRPARFITEPNMARLDKLRSAYDPDGRFHSWMSGV